MQRIGRFGFGLLARPIDGAALGLHTRDQLHKGPILPGGKLGLQQACTFAAVVCKARAAVADHAAFEGALVVAVHTGNGQPHAGRTIHVLEFHAGGDFKGAPVTSLRGKFTPCGRGRRLCEMKGGPGSSKRACRRVPEELATCGGHEEISEINKNGQVIEEEVTGYRCAKKAGAKAIIDASFDAPTKL